MNHPARPEQFKSRLIRISEHAKSNSPMLHIPAIAAFECKMVLNAYYGGQLRTSLALFREWFYLWRHDIFNSAVIWICDRVGWTRLYDVPETETMKPYRMRHGRNCSGSPNCQNMNCIDDSIPKWFRWLTGWHK